MVHAGFIFPGAIAERLSLYRSHPTEVRESFMPGRLLRDERGATAIEYALIATLISIACIIAFVSLGLNLADIFATAGNAMG